MSSKDHDSNQTALEKFATRRLVSRKRIFGAPIDPVEWAKAVADANARRPREVDGVSFAQGGDIRSRPERPLDRADKSPLAVAIRKAFPNSKPAYWAMIARRYRELYKGLTEDEAVLAVSRGYSSPADAMRARVIPKRKYIGFERDRAS